MKTRRSIRTAAVAVAAASIGLGLFGVPGTSAGPLPVQLPTEGLIDLTVDIEGLPGEHIAPAGEAGVVYRIETSNVGLEHLGTGTEKAVVTGQLPTGFTLVDDGGCTVTMPTYSCSITTFPQTFDITTTTADATETYTATATATVTSRGILEPAEFLPNNEDTETTTVYPSVNTDGAAWAHVCSGCTVSFSDQEVGSATITDPGSPNGFFVRLLQDDTFTGPNWESALKIEFDEDAEGYQVEDPLTPVRVRYVPVQAPCSGVGAEKCARLGMYDPDPKFAMVEPELLQSCDGAGVGVNPGAGSALVNGVYRVCRDESFKVGQLVGHEVLMITKDPLLPPISI